MSTLGGPVLRNEDFCGFRFKGRKLFLGERRDGREEKESMDRIKIIG